MRVPGEAMPKRRSSLGGAYWLLLSSELVSRAGDGFRLVAVTFFTFSLTDSLFATALQFVITSLPGFLFSGLAGRIADRFNPKLGLSAVALLSCFGTTAYALADSAYEIYVLNFLLALVNMAAGPMRAAWLPHVVGRENIARANGLRSSAVGIGDLIFPSFAGLIVGVWGGDTAFVIDAFTFLCASIGFLLVPISGRINERPPSSGQLSSAATIGVSRKKVSRRPQWDFLVSRPDLFVLLICYTVLTGAGQGLSAVFLPFLQHEMRVGTEGYGLVISAFLFGHVLSGPALSRWGQTLSLRTALVIATVSPICWMAIAAVPPYWGLVLLVVIDGAVTTASVTFVQSRFQIAAPSIILGRVTGLVLTFHFGAEVAGALLGAALSSWLGFSVAFLILATTALISALIGVTLFRSTWLSGAPSVSEGTRSAS